MDALSNTLSGALDTYSGAKGSNLKSNLNKGELDKTALKEQTDAFEAFLVKEVLDIALKEDEKNSLFPKDAGDKIYKSMYNESMSQALSGNFGFSELLYNFLLERSK